MKLLLQSFNVVSLVVGICVEMDETSFDSFSLVPLLVGICVKMDETSFEFIESCAAAD